MTLRQHIDGTLVYDESMRLCYPPPWCGVDLPSAMYQKAVDILNDSDSGWNDRKFKRKQTQTKAIEKQGGGHWLPLSPSPTRLMIVHETP